MFRRPAEIYTVGKVFHRLAFAVGGSVAPVTKEITATQDKIIKEGIFMRTQRLSIDAPVLFVAVSTVTGRIPDAFRPVPSHPIVAVSMGRVKIRP
jgi:hypothetical protein